MNKKEKKAQALFNSRAVGVLPRIDINGTDFTVDWRLKELRETAKPWNSIDLRNMEMLESGEHYVCLYNVVEHRIYDFDENITALPKNVVMLEIPEEAKLDPYAVARENDIDPLTFIRDFPIQNELKAIVKPLSETALPELVELNLEKIERSKTNNLNEDAQNSGRKIGR